MRKIVYMNDGSVPVEEILCTTYQMRNFYEQFRDGFFSELDMMNYIQHFVIAKTCRKGMTVLDACCGRGLLLPLLRYYAKDIRKYIGVDIEKRNIRPDKDIRNGKTVPDNWYPFQTEWIICNVAEMDTKIHEKIDLLVYISSIEHMHKVDGIRSLKACYNILKTNGRLYLSCPNTPEDQDGYNVQYKAHVYEWKLSELKEELQLCGFKIGKQFGIYGQITDFKKKILPHYPKVMREHYRILLDYLPREVLNSILFLPYPEFAKEVLLIAEK